MARISLLLGMMFGCLWLAAGAQAAEPQRLVLAVVDQRTDARMSVDALEALLEATLDADVQPANNEGGPANLGLLSVVVTPRGATVEWTMPDGRAAFRTLAHGPTPKAITARIAAAVGDMAMELSRRRALAEGDLVDPYVFVNERPRLPMPWSEATYRWQRLKPLDPDLVNPFESIPVNLQRVGSDTIDPWSVVLRGASGES